MLLPDIRVKVLRHTVLRVSSRYLKGFVELASGALPIVRWLAICHVGNRSDADQLYLHPEI